MKISKQKDKNEEDLINKQKALNELIPPNLINEVITEEDFREGNARSVNSDHPQEESKQCPPNNETNTTISTTCSTLRLCQDSGSKDPQTQESVLEKRDSGDPESASSVEHPSKGVCFYHNAPKF